MNEEQLRAIKYLNNTLLIAGAGTGKTTTIINKIQYLLNNNIYKDNELLIISFTNESVNDIKKKLNNNVAVKTFHKLAIDLIRDNNIKICNSNYLDFIIDEYFVSFAKYDIRTKRIIKRIRLEKSLNNFKVLIKTFINLYKSNYYNNNELFNIYLKSHFITRDYIKIILDIFTIYQNELKASGLVDFNDMIFEATKRIDNNEIKTNYKYVIIDEFQDTSLIRFKLILSILKQNKGKLFAVGDDYQSIYRFSGCDLNIFLNIKKWIPNIKILKLVSNYRNPSEIAYVSNDFIMQNKAQLVKETKCYKNIGKPIKIIFYVNKKTVIDKVLSIVKGKILILGRNNKDKIDYSIKENDNVRFLTIHKSKGLEEENVILINLENNSLGLPSKIKNEYILNKVLKRDYYPYEEERRLFYVALTRTKNNIYLIVPFNDYSVFIKELINNYYNYIDFIKM